jgi:U3 small nucleolar RNA-associated protein 7
LNQNKTKKNSFLEKDDDNEKITQHDIIEQVDLFSAQKYFDLNLDKFGPYRLNYTRNGRHLLIGGSKGHVAAFDWQTKKLHCEINVMESINDVK